MSKRMESQRAGRSGSTGTTAGGRLPINGETLRAAVAWIARAEIFRNLKLHGNATWCMPDLVLLAVQWVWSDKPTLTNAFLEARGWSIGVLGHAAVDSYQGLLNALLTWTGRLLPLVWQRLHELMELHGGEHWRIGRWLPLAVDGSRVSVPRTKDNEQTFCAPHYGHSATARYRRKKNQGKRRRRKEQMQPVGPQIWLTLLWQMGLQMPWSWRTGPSYSSERTHFSEILEEQEFPENTLFCGDAGFSGYDFWKQIIDCGHSFLFRVGGNVTLLRKLGYVRERNGIVYCWPSRAARRNQPPIALRLLHFNLGKSRVYVVTNVLNEKHLSEREAVQLYQLRWGVELQFRAIKQTFGRRKLRCKNPDRALVELDWSLIGLWMIQLFAVKEQVEVGEVPERCSVALAIEVIRRTLQRWWERPLPDATLSCLLRGAVKDNYRRRGSKQARYLPAYKDKPSAGKPRILFATKSHKTQLALHLNAAA